MYHVKLFIIEKIGFGMTPKRCGIHFKPQPLLQKTCMSYSSETLVAYTGMCLRMQAKGLFGDFIFKIDFFSLNWLYFPF